MIKINYRLFINIPFLDKMLKSVVADQFQNVFLMKLIF